MFLLSHICNFVVSKAKSWFGIRVRLKERLNLSQSAKKQEQTAQGTAEAYLVLVRFDNGLKTNYGEHIKTDKSTSGLGEIITKDRRLIQRFFDNLKYVMKKITT